MENNTWTKQYIDNDMLWPSEMLIRMMKGTRLKRLQFDHSKYHEQCILDVGCGDCSNFPLYKQLNFKEICGVEITQGIVDLNIKRMKEMGINSDIRVGSNIHIPFEDEKFDYLVSWNACYYMGNEKSYFLFDEYMKEFARCLKLGGIFIFSIPMYEHGIYKRADAIDENYVIIRNDPLNIRNGVVMRRFKNEREIQMEMEKYFSGIEFGKLMDDYFGDDDAHWWIGYCRKR